MIGGGRVNPFEPIVPVNRTERLPMSLMQEGRLLFELGAETHSDLFLQGITPLGLSFTGPLSIDALSRALNETVNRHEALRTGFSPTAYVGAFKMDGWRQIREFFDSSKSPFKPKIAFTARVHPSVSVPVPVIDLEKDAGDGTKTTLNRTLGELIESAFDYETPPLLRAALVRFGAGTHRLYIVFSHVVADGWSLSLFSGELLSRYVAIVSGTEAPLEHPSLQYADFAGWQRRRLQGKVLDRMLAYCNRRYKEQDVIYADDLPFARAPWNDTLESGSATVRLEPSASEPLRRFAQERRTTPFVTLLAAFNIVLFTLTERNRVGVWTFLANRSHPDTERMIGWFAQNHLLVMDLSTNPTVADLVQQARNVVIEANAFQDLPPQLLARALGAPKRKRPRISFEMLAQPQTERARLPQGMRIGPAPLPRFLRHPEAGLKLHVHDFGLGAINFSAQFAADRFQTPDVQDLLSQVCRVARQMVRFPYARLSSFNAHAKA
jgi:hypothetical protein